MTGEKIESECCREDARAEEPCGPFIDLQRENERLRKALRDARRSVAENPDPRHALTVIDTALSRD